MDTLDEGSLARRTHAENAEQSDCFRKAVESRAELSHLECRWDIILSF